MKHQYSYTHRHLFFFLYSGETKNWSEAKRSHRHETECRKTALSCPTVLLKVLRVLQPIRTSKTPWIFNVFSGWPRGLAGWLWSMVADNQPIAEGHNLVLVCWWQCEAAASNGAVIGHYSCGERLKASLPLFVLTSLFYSHHTLLHFPSLRPALL